MMAIKMRWTCIATLAIVLVGGCPNTVPAGGGSASTDGSGGSTTTGGSGGSTSTGGSTTTTGTTDADRILELVNQERTSRGLISLARNTQLDAAAEAHAQDMRDGSFFDHTGSDGGSVSDRATTAGYAWTLIGENIGSGDVTAEAMMDLWMNSAGHRANILNADFEELGVGINDSGTTLWVQVFGRP